MTMKMQISRTIYKREHLMKEYVKSKVQTEIVGEDHYCHIVRLIVRGMSLGTIPVGKNTFRDWLKERKEVK